MKARERYNQLSTARQMFLDKAVECSELTLPYLIDDDISSRLNHKSLTVPWQSVGAKCVVTLAAKLMLAVLPPQTSFFKLQVRDDKLGEELDPQIRSELDLSFSKMERMIMDYIAASNDRVAVHQALKHLIVGGNALIFMGKDGLKTFPLTRYVINRDGDGNVLEIVTKELISRQYLEDEYPDFEGLTVSEKSDDEDEDYNPVHEDVEVYTHITRNKNKFTWHQEINGVLVPKSNGSANADVSPWIPLRFNTCDGEAYGRGRVEEFIGDLKSLEALSQALVEGSAAAAKVVFTVSPSSTTKPQTLAKAGNGAIVQGRPDDIGVVQVGKTADFGTAYQLSQQLERRLSEAFLILTVRQSERTTAEEVRMTQMELEQQLGGLFSLLTTECLIPYLNRKMHSLTLAKKIPKIPKNVVNPTIVAGINALGRGQDRDALVQFVTTIAQTMGPQALQQYINPDEAIKRLAAAQGIDVLNLVKSMEELDAQNQQAQQQAMQQNLMGQAGQLAGAPLMDPSKNPEVIEALPGMMAMATGQPLPEGAAPAPTP